jgi:hypothetical protein
MKLTANQKRSLRRLWKGDSTAEEICVELDFTAGELEAAALILSLPERTAPECYLPTPAQIRLECAKIRAGWHPAEREARLGRMNIPTKGDIDAGRSTARDSSDGGSADNQQGRRNRR